MTVLKEEDGYVILGEKEDNCIHNWSFTATMVGIGISIALGTMAIISLNIPYLIEYANEADINNAICMFVVYVLLALAGGSASIILPWFLFRGCGIYLEVSYRCKMDEAGGGYIPHTWYQFSGNEAKDAEQVKEIITDLSTTAEYNIRLNKERTRQREKECEDLRRKESECCTQYKAVMEKLKKE